MIQTKAAYVHQLRAGVVAFKTFSDRIIGLNRKIEPSVKRRFVSSDFFTLISVSTSTPHLFSEFHVSLLSALYGGRRFTPGASLGSEAKAAPSF